MSGNDVVSYWMSDFGPVEMNPAPDYETALAMSNSKKFKDWVSKTYQSREDICKPLDYRIFMN